MRNWQNANLIVQYKVSILSSNRYVSTRGGMNTEYVNPKAGPPTKMKNE